MPTELAPLLNVPYFRPSISDAEIEELVACVRSGWLTSGPRARAFEEQFAEATQGKFAVAVNSCTAALHLAVEALGLRPGQAVLVPTMTFAATAEVVQYQGAIPILVDCDPRTLHLDLVDAERKLRAVESGELLASHELKVVGIMPVHVGGMMMDMDEVAGFARCHGLWIVEDAAHAFPAAFRHAADGAWRRCGENTADVSCYSFYANKTITTGEGGMAVTNDEQLAQHMRQMSLHGLTNDAWNRFDSRASWDYRIVAPGYKYNLTDIAASLGIHQLRRAEAMRQEREAIAKRYFHELDDLPQVELPPTSPDRLHAWHLFPIRLNLDEISLSRNEFMEHLKERGIGCSVHWRPLHLHPYYEEHYRWTAHDLPVATSEWSRLVSLPIFAGMRTDEQERAIRTVRDLCLEFSSVKATSTVTTRIPC